jgi:hypothetical protein
MQQLIGSAGDGQRVFLPLLVGVVVWPLTGLRLVH